VAGLNGRDEVQTLSFDLSFITAKQVQIFSDTATKPWDIRTQKTLPTQMTCQPRGGFIFVIK
jgi:hypothetical protein